MHGLTGGQVSTWTAPGATVPWPKLFLADDLKDARISAFDYDADVVNLLGPAGQNNIGLHASDLLKGIADMWLETEIVGRPRMEEFVILICIRKSSRYFSLHTVWEVWYAKR